jgi:hypothetical protein
MVLRERPGFNWLLNNFPREINRLVQMVLQWREFIMIRETTLSRMGFRCKSCRRLAVVLPGFYFLPCWLGGHLASDDVKMVLVKGL